MERNVNRPSINSIQIINRGSRSPGYGRRLSHRLNVWIRCALPERRERQWAASDRARERGRGWEREGGRGGGLHLRRPVIEKPCSQSKQRWAGLNNSHSATRALKVCLFVECSVWWNVLLTPFYNNQMKPIGTFCSLQPGLWERVRCYYARISLGSSWKCAGSIRRLGGE